MIVGGIDMMSQAIALQNKPHVIVVSVSCLLPFFIKKQLYILTASLNQATPGRIVDHLENTKGFHLKSLKILVMDEVN